VIFKISYQERKALLILVCIISVGVAFKFIKKKVRFAQIEQKFFQKCINVNKADFKELVTLPFIGEKIAKEIIKERQKKPFNSLEDLLRVKGIGNKKLEKIKRFICFD